MIQFLQGFLLLNYLNMLIKIEIKLYLNNGSISMGYFNTSNLKYRNIGIFHTPSVNDTFLAGMSIENTDINLKILFLKK